MSYSIDFRRKVISTRKEEGLSIRETAKQFRIGPASVSRCINQFAISFRFGFAVRVIANRLKNDYNRYPDMR
ncbi:IS630 transposase-related protein [Symbiopectobacterium sp. RP]|uniref:IS630 transposase-related protein n=1 Tax=Symbiopectobacterium sp. RP TaxID=3248553 RepID=UPI003D27D090